MNLLRGRARLLCHLSYLFGDDGEAFSLLACTRRFDGGIETEEVRLLGDAVDKVDDLDRFRIAFLQDSGLGNGFLPGFCKFVGTFRDLLNGSVNRLYGR